jgi:hypothetical protein
MDRPSSLLPLTNPLATPAQLQTSASALDGIPPALERSLRYHGSLLTQSAGVLLQLPQPTTALAVATFQRFYLGPEGGSFRLHSTRQLSAACVYLAAKLSATPQGPRHVLNVYQYLCSAHSPLAYAQGSFRPEMAPPADVAGYTLTEGEYAAQRLELLGHETLLLRTLGFTTKLALPHALALTYLQTLGLLPTASASTVGGGRLRELARRTVGHLNAALLSPQLLYLTHQPHALAVAAVYLAARETGVRIGGVEWWEVWDVGREELGFLVVALGSVEGWVREEGPLGKGCWTVEDVEVEMGRDG